MYWVLFAIKIHTQKLRCFWKAPHNIYVCMYSSTSLTFYQRDIFPCSTDPPPPPLTPLSPHSTLLSSILTSIFNLSCCCLSFASAIWASPKAYILFKRGSISLHLSASLFPLSHCFPHHIALPHQRSIDWYWTLKKVHGTVRRETCFG